MPGNVELSGGLAFFFYHGSDLSSRVPWTTPSDTVNTLACSVSLMVRP